MTQTQQTDTGIVKRGLLLLGAMTALAVVVVMIVMRRPDAAIPSAAHRHPLLVPNVIAAAPFPATLGWPVLERLNEQLPSAPGWEVRYNAAAALARRGSPNMPWMLLREMLDEARQQRNFRTLKNGQLVPHEEDAQRTVYSALVAVADWHKKQNRVEAPMVSPDLQLVYEQVDHLAMAGNTMLRVQADRTRQTFFRK